MKLTPHIEKPDDFYDALIVAHEGLSEAASADLNARLVFLLANQIGDARVLADCVAMARSSGEDHRQPGAQAS